MPVCIKCQKTQPSAEVRRTSRAHICKDRAACHERALRLELQAKAEYEEARK